MSRNAKNRVNFLNCAYVCSLFNPLLRIYSFSHIEEKSFRKTLWKKLKSLKMSNFTFLHNVFFIICKSLNPLTHSHTVTPFDASGKEAPGKHCGKRRNCLYKQFLLFQQCFLLYQRQKLSFLLHLICRLQMLSIWTGSKFCHVAIG